MRFELTIGHPSTELLDIQTSIFTALDNKVSRICFPCGLIGPVKSIYPEGPYSTIIGYPYGIDSPQLKLHSIIESARRGIKAVEVVINQYHIRNLDYKQIASEFAIVKKVTDDMGLHLRAILEHRLESISRNVAIAKVIETTGVEQIVTATGSIVEYTPDAIVNCYKIRENTELEVITYSNCWNETWLKSLTKAGGFIARTNTPHNIF